MLSSEESHDAFGSGVRKVLGGTVNGRVRFSMLCRGFLMGDVGSALVSGIVSDHIMPRSAKNA